MAIAGAVLHQLATHVLPLCCFATHYSSLTDDYNYHPNIRNMHMGTVMDEDERKVCMSLTFMACSLTNYWTILSWSSHTSLPEVRQSHLLEHMSPALQAYRLMLSNVPSKSRMILLNNSLLYWRRNVPYHLGSRW